MQNDNSSSAAYMQDASAPHSRYPATSSAFSASAHPHEDWTKISDLAERRRIQNRIAQRNYRKKLKKRLEDLERKAGSASLSPEQQPAQLATKKPVRKSHGSSHRNSISQKSQSDLSEVSQPGIVGLSDSQLFAEQYTRQLSTSPPPPFAYPLSTQESYPYSTYATTMPYTTVAGAFQDSVSYAYNPFTTATAPMSTATDYPVKAEFYPDIDMNTFGMTYAPLPSIELPGHGFDAIPPQTPPLSDCYESCCAASPPESSLFPPTPAPYETSPRLTML